MRRMLFITLTALAALSVLVVPGASAVDAEPRGDAEAKVDEVRPDRPKIRCRGAIGLGGAPKVRCRWRVSEHPDAAGYKVVRVHGDDRSVVFETDDVDVRRFTDKDVEFSTRYRYRLIVVDENGDKLQRSRWDRAIVRKPDTERLKMACGVADAVTETADAEPHSILCEWRPAQGDSAVEYQLWRRIRGQHRELVTTVGLDTLSHLDTVPADTTKVVYAVLALDADGEIVGRSGLSKIRFPVQESPA